MEFISAKDLPITEAEEVDVLCVENGEMKRKPAKGLGGNGEYDFDMAFKTTWNAENEELVCDSTINSVESFEVLKEKIFACEEIRAKFAVQSHSWGTYDGAPYATENIIGPIFCTYFPEGTYGDEAPELIRVEQWGSSMYVGFMILPDNSLVDVYGGFD